MPNTDANQKPGSGSTICSAIETPEAELRHLTEMARANGFESIWDAVDAAKTSTRSDVERVIQGLAYELRALAQSRMDRGDMADGERDESGRTNHAHYAEAFGLYAAASVAEEQLLPRAYEPTADNGLPSADNETPNDQIQP